MQTTGKRLIVATLGLVLMAGLGFGGGRRQDTGTGETAAPKNFPGGWKPTADYGRRQTLSIADVLKIEGYDYTNGDDYLKFWSSMFNVNLDVISLGFDDWAERLRIWISSGDMPDVVVFDYNHADASSWIDQEMIKKFPDNWKQRWPNLARSNSKSTLAPQMEQVFGGTYFISRPRFDTKLPGDPLPNHISFFYRKDWAEAIGFPIKPVYTTGEIIEFGRQIKAKDPGNVGARLIPITGRPEWATRLFVSGNSTHARNFYRDKNNVYQWGGASADTLAGLKLLHKAWTEGVFNREFYTLNYQEDYDQLYVSGIAAGFYGEAVCGQITLAYNNFTDNIGPDPEKCIGLATVVGEDNLYHQEDLINFWGCIAFSPNISNEKFERYMDMMDFACSEEGYLFTQMGFEGIDWKRNADGSFDSLLKPDERLSGSTGKYPSMTLIAPKLSDDFSFDNPSTKKIIRDTSWRLYQDRCKQANLDTFTPVDWTLYCFDSPSMRKVQLDYAYDYTNIVVNSRNEADLEANWRRWITTNKPLIDPVLAELNSIK
jgi:putative aldouronate transport system substrate-binding protein